MLTLSECWTWDIYRLMFHFVWTELFSETDAQQLGGHTHFRVTRGQGTIVSVPRSTFLPHEGRPWAAVQPADSGQGSRPLFLPSWMGWATVTLARTAESSLRAACV